MTDRIFTLAPEEYNRDINFIDGAFVATANYLCRLENIPFEEALAWTKENISFEKGATFELNDPKVYCFTKDKYGDRQRRELPFTEYIGEVVTEGNILGPTMVVYLSEDKCPSILSEYLAGNIKERAMYKAKEQEAAGEGDNAKKAYYFNMQTGAKFLNNAVSGAHANDHNPLFNLSTHSMLTSTCRCVTSYGAATVERLLAGHRHLWNAEVVIAYALSIIDQTDFDLLQRAMDEFNLVYPSFEDTMECIRRSSTAKYWRNAERYKKIEEFIATLTPLERAAYVYIGDLYHLAKLNHDLVYNLISDIINVHINVEVEDPVKVLKGMDNDMRAMVNLLRRDDINKRKSSTVIDTDPVATMAMAKTAVNAQHVLEKHRVLIRALFVTPNLPLSIAALPNIIRESVIAFDTDSNIFTTEYWTEWYVGKFDFSKTSYDVSYVMAYLASMCVVHNLALVSANIGIPARHIHRLAMKNEYSFIIFALTNRAKHYNALQYAKEGEVMRELELEKKGVGLRDSNVPVSVMQIFDDFVMETFRRIMEGELTLDWVYNFVYEIEQEIFKSVESGKATYLNKAQIRPSNTYKNPAVSMYAKHTLWEEVFADKYGAAPEPPYSVAKVSVDLNNGTKIAKWLLNIKDEDVRARLMKYLESKGGKAPTAFFVPMQFLANNPVPEEMMAGVDSRKIVFGIMTSFYLFLETLNVFCVNKHLTKLVSDIYKPGDKAA